VVQVGLRAAPEAHIPPPKWGRDTSSGPEGQKPEKDEGTRDPWIRAP